LKNLNLPVKQKARNLNHAKNAGEKFVKGRLKDCFMRTNHMKDLEQRDIGIIERTTIIQELDN